MDRKDRNRRGGHETAMPSNHRFGDEFTTCTPVEKKIIKRLSKKKMRRQWSQAQVQAAINNDWTWADEIREIEEEEALLDDYNWEPMEPYSDEELWDLEDDDYDYAHGCDSLDHPFYDNPDDDYLW